MKKRKILAAFLSALMVGAAALPVGDAFAEDVPVVTEEENANWKSMTFDQAVADISGEFTWVSGGKSLIYPGYSLNPYFFTIDKSGKIHIIYTSKVETAIKFKEGTVLPYDDIKAAVEAEGMVMPAFRKNGDEYDIIYASSKKAFDYTIELIKACPDVVSIEMHYCLYEDTANSVDVNSFGYNGDMTEDELTAAYPDFEISPNKQDGGFTLSYKGSIENKFEAFRSLDNADGRFKPLYVMTCLALLDPPLYYCNEPMLIDGTLGDANIDGYVDLSDSVMIMQSLANPDKYGITAEKGITAQGKANADTDNDGLTNIDALNIQKSLLGMGDIPIPPKDADIPIVSYDHINFTEKDDHAQIRMNDTTYLNCGVTVPMREVGEEIGEQETALYSGGKEAVTLYRMANYPDEVAVLAKYSDGNDYHVYRNMFYKPATVGEFIDSLNLKENLGFDSVALIEHKPEYKRNNFDPNREKIWEIIFSDRDAETVTENFSMHRPSKAGTYQLEIGCELPLFGKFGFGLTVYENGFVMTNTIDCGTGFYIGEEKAQELISMYKE